MHVFHDACHWLDDVIAPLQLSRESALVKRVRWLQCTQGAIQAVICDHESACVRSFSTVNVLPKHGVDVYERREVDREGPCPERWLCNPSFPGHAKKTRTLICSARHRRFSSRHGSHADRQTSEERYRHTNGREKGGALVFQPLLNLAPSWVALERLWVEKAAPLVPQMHGCLFRTLSSHYHI